LYFDFVDLKSYEIFKIYKKLTKNKLENFINKETAKKFLLSYTKYKQKIFKNFFNNMTYFKLNSLYFRNNYVDDNNIHLFFCNKDLTIIDFSNNFLTLNSINICFKSMFDDLYLNNNNNNNNNNKKKIFLKKLNLSNCIITDYQSNNFDFLSYTNIINLNLSKNLLDNSTIIELISYINKSEIECLNIKKCFETTATSNMIYIKLNEDKFMKLKKIKYSDDITMEKINGETIFSILNKK